ncbi:MAG: toxin HicA [Geobacter sp.]|jgi:hypothetical protein
MSTVSDIITAMRNNPGGVHFNDLCKVCDHYFGQSRQTGGSHRVYKTPWSGDPRVNIQNDKGRAKTYQVKQVLRAIERMEVEHGTQA